MNVHLHVRSAYTFLNSTLTISKIIALAKNHHYDAIALVDLWSLHGAYEFYYQAKKEGIHPIIGMEVEVFEECKKINLVLLAKNDRGYQDLMQLSTNHNLEKIHYTIKDLVPFTKNCIVILSKDNDYYYEKLDIKHHDNLVQMLKNSKQMFDDFYIGLTCNDSGLMFRINQELKELAQQLQLKTVALSLIYYSDEKEEEIYKVLCAIDQGLHLQDKTLIYSSKRYFRSYEQMVGLYSEEDLEQASMIAQKCNVKMDFKKSKLPKFKNNLNIKSDQYLQLLCYKGLSKRMGYREIPNAYKIRLDYEIQVIINMKYEDYFLIVWDFIRYARRNKIYVGPGRGSAAGSLVAYCLGITHVDPIQYDLLFERFLNPERISMPDIDIDFPDNKRDEIIKYVETLYGTKNVSHICTFNTLGAKQAIRDVGRVLKVSIKDINLFCRLIPNVPKVTLKYAYAHSERLKQLIHSSNIIMNLFRIASQIEGLPRHISVHAAGIVLSDQPIVNVCPLVKLDSYGNVTQFTMEHLESLGLIKIDFLGLKNLTIIDDIVKKVNKDNYLDIMKIPLDDKKTYELLRKVDTVGIFQLESEGIQALIKQLQPKEFEDIVALIALFRPGPMEHIPQYLARRSDSSLITYTHKDLEPILKNTYGIMIYQEQISATRCI